MSRPQLLSPNEAALNEERVKALTAKYSEKMSLVALAALGALTQFVQPDILEEALMAAQVSVFLHENNGSVRLLKDE